MPATIDGLAGQVNGVLRDMWAAGDEQVRAYCLQLARPTLDQIREITLRAERFVRDHESANMLRGYAHLRPSETDELHRAKPTPLTRLAIEQEYVPQEHEWRALKIEQARYMHTSSIAPLSKRQLNELYCHFNSKAARTVLRARGRPSRPLRRFLNRQQAGAERLMDGTAYRIYERLEDQIEIRPFEAALRLRNKRRAERTLPAERQRQLQSRPTIADFCCAAITICEILSLRHQLSI